MQVFDWIAAACATIAGYFYSIGNTLSFIPGAETLLDSIGGNFTSLEGWFGDVGTWADGITSDVISALAQIEDFLGDVIDIDAWREIISDLVAEILSGIEYLADVVLGVLGPVWDDLIGLWNNFTGYVGNALGIIEISFSYVGKAIVDSIPNLVGEVYYNMRDLIDNFPGYVQNTIEHVGDGLLPWFESMYAKVAGPVLEVVIEALDYLIQEAFLVLERSWSSFEDSMKWLVGKIIDMVADAAEDFAEKIWDMVEKVVEKL